MLSAVHVVAGLAEADGGPSYSIPRLCEALAAAGEQTTLLSVAAAVADDAVDGAPNGYVDRRFRWDYADAPGLRGLRCSSRLVHALREAAITAEIVHNHGLWLMPNVEAGRAAARAGKPFVVSPRGMLAPAALAFSRTKKQAFWRFLQGAVVRRAACLHATSEAEYEEIRAFGLDNPVAVIPNGVDLPEQAARPVGHGGERIALSLGRVHPKKGLDRLIHAWARVESEYPLWRLRIVGPSEDGHADQLRALARSLALARASIEGPVYGEAKWAAYRDADLFVLSTLNENFGLTVAEALAAGTPVIATKGAPWSGLETEGCGWWVEHGVDALAAAMANAMAMPRETLHAMGLQGRIWMARDFSWARVARDMADVYRWLSFGGERVSTIRLG